VSAEEEAMEEVRECMTTEVVTCRPDASMEQAARLMWEHDCGVLPVVEGERVAGIVTDRDLCMGTYTRGRALCDLRVKDSMAKEVFACRPADPLEQALRDMADHQVRRAPVVDELGRLVGILSMNDVVRHVAGLRDARARANLSARLVETLAAICEPRRAGERARAMASATPKPAQAFAAKA
jgi:CBS domain-containing protein